METTVDKLFTRFGREGQLVNGRLKKDVRVFFWGTMRKSVPKVTPLGRSRQETYICYFQKTVPVQAGMGLILGEDRYEICQVEALHGQKESCCQWAICVRKEGEDTWGA